ncbi:hypothetical protein JR316_0001723 [Psilocybe cubensis]|uniref:Uncharacterized protein n=1 Tax=Psilocybe cubensis TaxID=181762 RepID=A0ACB8HA77_PSICU|nr:hypothetical protein JR316_0001723 [Psilocybe cubensis]KAH9484821.1 hypothetical protein JR316_0001723 [Psilocybe cubensis]
MLFAIAPLLREVRIFGVYNYCDFLVPWWQLVILDDTQRFKDDTFSTAVLDILPTMGHIQELKLSWGIRAQTHLPFRLLFDNLEVLHVQFWSRCHRGLLDNLILPNLIELKITGQHRDPTDSIISLIKASWNRTSMLQKAFVAYIPLARTRDHTPSKTDLAALIVDQEHLLVPDLRVLRILADTVCGDGIAAIIHKIGVSRLIANDNPAAPLAVCVTKLDELTVIFPTDEDRLSELKFLEDGSGSSAGILTVSLPEQIHDFLHILKKSSSR